MRVGKGWKRLESNPSPTPVREVGLSHTPIGVGNPTPTVQPPWPLEEVKMKIQPPRNRHPVDELADVRAEVKRLQLREAELRKLILAEECELTGDQYEAVIRRQESERIDVDRLRRELGMERLRPFVKNAETFVIKLKLREALEDAYQD